MLNNLTCVTCHDIHQDADKVMLAAGQADVCTVCHKAQKAGLHGLESQLADNPPCSSCHNPHDGESALGTMLDNDSAGCRSCHDLVAMAADPAASVKAGNYHLVMAQADRTCLDCHQGIAHGPATAVAAFVPQASNTRTVALFYPAQSTSQWLQTRHPGSQALRQGRNCQQCHRGEEPHMATVLADDIRPALRQIQVSFSRDEEDLQVMLRWPGAASDASISLMWGDDAGSAAFRRGGCFAACHDDMTGMGRDRGQKTAKYLAVSRARLQGIGQPAQRRPGAELTALVEQGNVVEFWQINLNGGQASATAAALLAEPIRDHSSRLSASASHEQGIWTVSVRRPLAAGLKPFRADAKYTLGIALNGAANPGGRHWVSMPMTLSLGGDDTDFRVD
jgi:predicted CXXCH cytochrome family protein